jgi:hypothetical protein
MTDPLDDLRQRWHEHTAALARCIAIDERLLRHEVERRVRRVLLPFVLVRAAEVLAGAGAVVLLAPVVWAHATEPRYLVAGGVTLPWLIGLTASSAWLATHAATLDHDAPVARRQPSVARLRAVEYAAFTWALFGGVLAWLPGLLLLFEAVTGVAGLQRVDGPYLVANLAVGALVLTGGRWWSRAVVERTDAAPWARRLRDALSGRALQRSAAELAELDRLLGGEGEAEGGERPAGP